MAANAARPINSKENMVRFLILGAGELGYSITHDLIRSPRTEMVVVADKDASKVQKLKESMADEKIVPVELDVEQEEYVAELMAKADVAISCLPATLHFDMAKLALSAKTSFCAVELCPDPELSERLKLLDEVAKDEGVAIIPSIGLAPGLISILAVSAADSLDELYEIKIRLGVLPVENEGSLDEFRAKSFNPREFLHPVKLIKEGKVLEVPALTEADTLDFPAPIGKTEVFLSYGGAGRLPELYKGRIRHLDFKSIHYPGFLDRVSLLKDLGLFSNKAVELPSGKDVIPSELTEKLLSADALEAADLVVIKIIVTGVKDEKPIQHVFDCVDYGDPAERISACTRMTAYPASIVAQMLAREDIKGKGVLIPEEVVPARLFLAELDSRGIRLTMTERAPVVKD